MNRWPRRLPLLAAILLLSIPAALGIMAYLEPTRGWWGSRSAALGLEMLYLSTGILILDDELRRYARSVAISAVVASVVFNTLQDYGVRVPGGLKNTQTFLATFDVLSAILSFIESLPLAGLAYAATILAHRLAEQASSVQPTTAATKVLKPSLAHRLKGWFAERFKRPAKPASVPATPTGNVLVDAINNAFLLRRGDPTTPLWQLMDMQQFTALKAELTQRKASEAKTVTINSLWGLTGGAQYQIASRIYDELTS